MMAGNLDEFTINYKIQVNAAIQNLDKLNKKTADTNKKLGESEKTFSGFAKGALKLKKDITGAAGGVESLVGAFDKLPGVAKGAAAALLVIAGAVKVLDKSMREYAETRKVAVNAGIGMMNVEAFQRNMSRASGGYVSASASRGIVSKIAAAGYASAQDFTQQGHAAAALRAAGVSTFDGRGNIASVNDQINQLSDSFSHMSVEMARARGAALGLNQQEVDALRKMSGAAMDYTNMSGREVQAHVAATKASLELESAYGSITESGRELRNELSDMLLPAFNDFMQVIAKVAETLPKAVDGSAKFFDKVMNYLNVAGSIEAGMSPSEALKNLRKENAALDKPSADVLALVDAESDSNHQQRILQAQFDQSIQQFAGATAQFAGTISESDAINAWAGDLGRQAGHSTSGNPSISFKGVGSGAAYDAGAQNGALGGSAPPGGYNNNPGNIKGGKYAISELGATGTDSRGFAIFPSYAAGDAAYAKLLSHNYADKGLNTISKIVNKYAPPSENDTAAYIANVSKWTGLGPDQVIKSKEDWMKLRDAMYKMEGNNHPPSGSAVVSTRQADMMDANAKPTWSWPSSSAGTMNPWGGPSREALMRDKLVPVLAARLGLSDPSQLMRGNVNRSDLAWTGSNLRTEALNGEQSIMRELATRQNMTPAEYSSKIAELGKLQTQLRLLDQFMPQLQAVAQDGPRDRSRNEPRVFNINITNNGLGDHAELAKKTQEAVLSAIGQATTNGPGTTAIVR